MDELWDPQEVWIGRGSYSWSSIAVLGLSLRIGSGGTERGEVRRSVGCLPCLLVDMAFKFTSSSLILKREEL